jgi:nickel/cobalt transporter (NicO) family protein
MGEALLLLATNFVYGAYHAIQPGHGKTIAAAYIVGARGRPVDAWILGIFVTLSHTSGIVLVGVLASLGLPGLGSHRIEAWLAVATGVLVILLGLWTLWTQRQLLQVAGWEGRSTHPGHAHGDEAGALQYRPHEHDNHAPNGLHGAQAHGGLLHEHDHTHPHAHGHDHAHAHTHGPSHDHSHEGGESAGYHTHGWGFRHTHDMDLVTTNRPSLWILIWLGIAGGLLPDPVALGLLMRALVDGKVMLGLAGVLVFSLGFAAVLVLVGVIAAAAGKKILDWLAGSWAARLQIGTSLIIVVVGVVLTVLAWQKVSQLT